MSTPRLEDIDIHELLPQQEPFVMIDRLTHFDMQTTSTRFTIREDNIFVNNGVMAPQALAENIAQTCAARLGYINKYILMKPYIQLGFIGAIKSMKLTGTVRVGDELCTDIEVIEQVMDIVLVKARVQVNGQVVATAEMKIALSALRASEK